MKYAIRLLVLMTPLAGETRSVITDPVVPGVTHCGFYVDSAARVTLPVVPAVEGNICMMNIDGIDAGAHTVVVTAISVDDPVWGSQESSLSSPLVLGKTATMEATARTAAAEATAAMTLTRAAHAAARFVRSRPHLVMIAALIAALALGGALWLRRRMAH